MDELKYTKNNFSILVSRRVNSFDFEVVYFGIGGVIVGKWIDDQIGKIKWLI